MNQIKYMEPLEIADKIKGKFPDEVLAVKEFRDQVFVSVKKNSIRDMCRYLHDEPELHFDYLVDLCGVDYLGKREIRYEVVYNLYSIKHKHRIRLKAGVTETEMKIDSVVPVWAGANWHERECFDMYGIEFTGHPDLRRILMPEDWEGHPLRKDYPLKVSEREWSGFLDVQSRAKRFKDFEWHE